MEWTIGIDEAPDDLAAVVDAEGRGRRAAWHIDRCVDAVAQEKAMKGQHYRVTSR